jgi:hypothetical protein
MGKCGRVNDGGGREAATAGEAGASSSTRRHRTSNRGTRVATHDSGPTRVFASCPCRSALPIHEICEHCMTVGDGDGRYGTSLQLKLDSSLGQPCDPATLPSSVHTAASTNLRTTVAARTAVTPRSQAHHLSCPVTRRVQQKGWQPGGRTTCTRHGARGLMG